MSGAAGASIQFADDVGFGRINELTRTIQLNRATATWDVLSHEISHMRFANGVGKWGTGTALSNFEINLMESIGYWGTYRTTGQMAELGSAFSQGALSTLRHQSTPAVRAALDRSYSVFGPGYVEDALRFNGLGLARRKVLP